LMEAFRMSARSLWPREHGAYAQLAAPLLAALVAAPPALAGALFAIAAVAGFLANEPLLVLLGHRGPRARQTLGTRARRRLALLAAIAVVGGIAGLAIAAPAARLACVVPGGLAVALVGCAWTRTQHSLAGELVACLALPAAALPVAVAAGAPIAHGLAISGAWSLGFACTVLAVHRVIARHRRPAGLVDGALVVGLAATAVVARSLGLAPAAPLVLASAGIAIWSPPATRLRAIGVALVAAAVGSAAVVICA